MHTAEIKIQSITVNNSGADSIDGRLTEAAGAVAEWDAGQRMSADLSAEVKPFKGESCIG